MQNSGGAGSRSDDLVSTMPLEGTSTNIDPENGSPVPGKIGDDKELGCEKGTRDQSPKWTTTATVAEAGHAGTDEGTRIVVDLNAAADRELDEAVQKTIAGSECVWMP